jgi:type IV pilus assembly protein PilM
MGLLDSFFKKKESSVLGIDIGSSAIKVVQLKKQGNKAILETYGELALGPYAGVQVGQATNLPTDKVIEALTDLLKEKEVNITTRNCGIAIPFRSSLMTLIEMPTTDRKQLEQMIPIEARKYIPVPITEVALDWTVIPRDEYEFNDAVDEEGVKPVAATNKSDVLVIAIHNDIISNYQSIIQKAMVNATFFEVEIFSTMRAVLDQNSTPTMILDMGASSTKLYIVEKGIVRTSHTINKGAQDVTATLAKSMEIPVQKAEILKREQGLIGSYEDRPLKGIMSVTLDYIFSEANRVLLSYERKTAKNIAKIILVGGGAALKGLAAVAQESFDTEVVAGDPFSKVQTPAFLEEVLKSTGPEFAVAVGIAIRKLQEIS